MTIAAGTRLGPYEIQAAIGAGGMGEVYKAKDTRLDRTVAIKVISSLVAGSAELRERFEREARTVSQLNHPNICTLHDVGREGGTEYLVLEYLEGESLSDRLARGPLPLEHTLSIATQICDALDKAHRAGIIHRDLKPGNVFLLRGATTSGPPTAKLLDFGLAKTAQGTPPGVNLTGAPTVTTPLTAQGTILGTFQYMAPEQLEGEEADARTDIWAFGCVLYEMVTGRKAFGGRTHASLISSIMGSQPAPIAAAQAGAPPVLDHVVRTCLAKEPDERFQTAHDLLLQLRWIGSPQMTSTTAAPARSATRISPAALIAALAVAVVATAAATWLLTRQSAAAPQPTIRASVTLPAENGYATFGAANLAITPDGTRLVYASANETTSVLLTRALDRYEPPVPLSGANGALMPFISPDGRWVGFVSSGKLKKMPMDGGAAVAICDLAVPSGAVWGPDDYIVFGNAAGILMRVPAGGGQPQPVTQLANGEVGHRWPALLPDGSLVFAVFAANVGGDWAGARIVVQRKDGSAHRTIIEAGTAPRYLRSGHLAFSRNGGLFTVPFDVDRLEVTGDPQQIDDAIAAAPSDGRVHYAVSDNGTLAYVDDSVERTDRTLVWVNRDGTAQPVGATGHAFDHPRISPDGRMVAVTVRAVNTDVWILDLSRGALSRFTFDPGEDESAVWTTDGKKLTWAGAGSGRRSTFSKPIDSSAPAEELFVATAHQHIAGWARDGKTLLLEAVDPTFGLYLGSTASRKVTSYLQTPFAEMGAHLSPDSAWIAYTSNESGRAEVYVQAFPGPGGRVQVSTEGGGEARWAPNGRELFYRAGDRMMVVPVEYSPTFRPGTPRLLFEGRYTRIGWGQANYDVSPDGRRFLVIKGEEQGLPTQIQIVVNFFDELRR